MGSDGATADLDEVAPVRRGRRRALRAALVVVVLLGLAYAALLVVAPAMARPKVARAGLRLYRCEALGGDIPPSLRGAVRLRPDLNIVRFTSVREGDTVYIGGRVTDAAGADLGPAVWTSGWRTGGVSFPVRAANDLARAVATNPAGSDPDPATGLVDAAADCTTKT